ncbi:hypothetical protein M5D96_006970 [Drosophila gunungcola]|uniref:Misexpression suppressor of ras 4 n=1 Tax=Drosophila gunungcola TaxID=103775 RepID=A0A9P9YMB8_9MUSC|nr:hypothetical protein M5D96_006970 [Drosophila gunungcola]
MMEALDQQQAKLTSNRDDGEAGSGSETGSGAGAGGEEDDFEEPHHGLGLAEEENKTHQQRENNNDQEEKYEGKRKKSAADDVIDLTLANGQEKPSKTEEEAAGLAHKSVQEESQVDVKKETAETPETLFTDLVKQEPAEDGAEELQEPARIPLQEEFPEDIKLKIEVEEDKVGSLSDNEMEFLSDAEEQPLESPEAKHVAETAETEVFHLSKELESEDLEAKYSPNIPNEDSESKVEEGSKVYLQSDSDSEEREFLSIKDPNSPALGSEDGKVDLYKDAVDEDGSNAEPEAEETTSQPAGESLLEGSDTVDSPSLTMDVDLPSIENGDATSGVIKIESDSEDEVQSDSVKSKKSTVEVVPTIKLNGAHQVLKKENQERDEEQENDEEQARDDEQVRDEEHVETGQMSDEPKQLSVITNHTGNNTKVEETIAPQESLPRSLILPIRRSRTRSTSSRSSTVSSASQPQLVIDHPESENNVRVQTLKLSLKRRRSKSSSVSQPEKQPKVEESGSVPSSLLLQRLQGNPNVGPPVVPVESQVLSCAKCNLQFKFESFQLLNEHQAQCSGSSSQMPQKKERFFRCAQCSSVHQCWHFFLHMREVHQRYICLYCNHVYPSVEKLSLHLENKHDIDQCHFAKDAWALQQSTEDRARHLVCCTCQATFVQGSEFEDHDCSQLMQPCALCGQKGGHAIGCKNNKRKPVRRRKKVRKPPEPPLPLPQEVLAQPAPIEVMPEQQESLPFQVQPEPQNLFPAENIPAPEPVEDPPAPPVPKLVVPKIMLRVPKEFQKSVDAALSSTDTEDEELDTTHPQEEAEPAPPEDLPVEAAPPPPPPALSFDDSTSAKLNRVLAELERTKLDIERTKADIITKKQAKVILAHAEVENVVPQGVDPPLQLQPQPEEQPVVTEFQDQPDAVRRNSLGSDCMDIDDSLNGPEMEDHQPKAKEESLEHFAQPLQESHFEPIPVQPLPPADGIMVAGTDTHTVDLQLDRPLDRFSMVDFVRLCLKSVYSVCLYCNHARRIAVNGKQLVLHLIGQHRFTATVDSITAEELHAETILLQSRGWQVCGAFNERIYECFGCRYVTSTHKELYTHNRRLHIKSNITCVMCQTNFYSYSEILCHICPGEVAGSIYDLQFRCCLCEMAPLPSAFRLMVHLRKQHQACDICLEDCQSQAKLSAHVWKHKLLHLCYRCGIAYRNKQDISKHLFWKHGTESASCKQCLQKRWRHVYHFCVPPAQFPCEQCGFVFSKAIYLEVHQRMHSGDFRYACTEEGCEEKFVSRKLLLKHAGIHEVKELPQPASEELTDKGVTAQNLDEIKKEAEDLEEKEDGKQQEEKDFAEAETNKESTKEEEPDYKESTLKEQPVSKSESRKRRKKSKRNKESLEDLNLIAPNLSESDSSDDSDSDAPRSSHQEQPVVPMRSSVDDLGMPKVMLSPSSESDADEADGKSKLEDKDKSSDISKEEKELEAGKADEDSEPKKEEEQVDVSIWKNLLQNQAVNPEEQAVKEEEKDAVVDNQPPTKLHVAWSDHDYCKLHRTPQPSPIKQKSTTKSSTKTPGQNASSESDSSSSSSSSESDSSSCSCGSNCSCSSSNSSSSSDDSDDSDSSNARGSPQKRARKKSLRQKKSSESLKRGQQSERDPEENVSVTPVNENNPAAPPSPKPPMYNESDFDTAFSDTDEEFYDSHPQKLANELLAQKREALMAEHAPLRPSNNYDIVENSRPSTPSLPEEASAFAEKRERVRNKKKKRERKSTCKSGKMPPMASTPLPIDGMVAPLEPPTPLQSHQESLFSVTPLTHRHLQSSMTRMSEGSSCSDADGQLKRSKRQRRPNKFYGYTSDDENMSAVLAPPLQVGMQLIKPQPPPQLTWAKEDLPTPPKQRSRNNNNSGHHHHSHSNGGSSFSGSSRKRSKQRSSLHGAGGSRSAKRHKPDREDHLPPIPTLKIRPSLLPSTAPPSDSSESSSDDEDAEINVTSLVATPQLAPPPPVVPAPVPVALPVQPPPPPPPAATAFNQPIPPALLPNPGFATLQYFKANNIRYPIRPPAGARLAREGESVYCYCRCPYDEVSEMIACDGDNCLIEWFHFECVGIMVAPQGKWFCAECRPKYSEGVYQGNKPQ